MIRREITEDIEITDVANKVNNNDYTKTYKIFGFTFFTSTYKLTSKVNEDKDESTPIGFTKNESR